MGKKQKKKTKNRRRGKTQPHNLPALGDKQLKNGQFSEAIKTFRQLLKQDGNGQWLPSLSLAYRGRITQLTAKGMFKEALVIYTNMVNTCSVNDQLLHINLLLNNGQHQQALEIFTTLKKSLSKEERQATEELFAALLLSGTDQLLQHLPDDSQLKNHFSHANLALKAYCREDDSEAEGHLCNISFRSPYRNFRLALKGMLIFALNREEAAAYFAKIPDNSPFLHWISPYRQLDDSVNQPIKLSRPEKQLIHLLKGVDQSTHSFLDGIRLRQNDPFKLYSFLVNRGAFLGRVKLKNICSRILPHAPEQAPDYFRRFGTLDDFEFDRMMGLAGEIEHAYWHAADNWQSALEALEKLNDSDNHLKTALICRHCAKLLRRDDPYHNITQIKKLLEKSLEHDPHDRDTYFELIDLSHNDLNTPYKIINRALQEFPDDIEVLFAAIEAAINRRAFKKASRLAAELLKIDPINTKARSLLINAHLEHGRKLAVQGKIDLALKECGSAAAHDRADLGRGKIEICRGLLYLLSGDITRGMALHDEGIGKAANPLLGCLRASLEARLLQIPQKWHRRFDKNLRAATKTAPDHETLLALATELRHCKGKQRLYLQEVGKIITPWLKKGRKLKLSREEYFSLCSVFHQIHFYDTLAAYAKQAARLFSDNPLVTFYYICGTSKGGEKPLSRYQLDQLSDAMHTAMERDDPKTSRLIDDFLNQYFDRTRAGASGFNHFAGKIIDEFTELVNNGEIDEEDFAEFCEEAGVADEIARQMDDFLDDEDEIFKLPPQLSGKDRNHSGATKGGKTRNKTTPTQFNLFQ